jgi:MFS family permease
VAGNRPTIRRAELGPAPPSSTPGSILRNRHFLALWGAQAISQTAQQAIWFGMIVVVESITRSGAQLSVAVLTTIFPAVLLGLVAGVLVDKMNKKTVLVTTNLLRAVAVLGYLLYPVSVYVVYLVNVVFVAISQFFSPAEAAAIPTLVTKRQLVAANSAFNITYTASQLVGIVIVAPWVIKLFGAPALFAATSVLYLIAAALVYVLPPGSPPEEPLSALRRETVVRDVLHEIEEALIFIRSDGRTWWSMIHITLTSCLMLILGTLAPRYAVSVLGITPEDAVFVLAPAFIGIVGVTLVLSRLVLRYGAERVVNVGLGILVVALLAFGGLGPLSGLVLPGGLAALGWVLQLPFGGGLVPPLMVVTLGLGIGYALASVPSQAVLMERAPADTRGRVFSVLWLIINVVAIVPLVFLGGLADLLGVSVTIGAMALPVGIALALGLRERRRWQVREAGPGNT